MRELHDIAIYDTDKEEGGNYEHFWVSLREKLVESTQSLLTSRTNKRMKLIVNCDTL